MISARNKHTAVQEPQGAHCYTSKLSSRPNRPITYTVRPQKIQAASQKHLQALNTSCTWPAAASLGAGSVAQQLRVRPP